MGLASSSVAQSSHPLSTASLSPNPAEGKTNLTFEEPINEAFTVVIKDLTGKTMFSVRPEFHGDACSSVPLDVEALRRGIYICQITSQSGKVKTLKFQKT